MADTEISIEHEAEHEEHHAEAAAAEVAQAVELAEHEAREEGRELGELHAADAVIAEAVNSHRHEELEQRCLSLEQELTTLRNQQAEHLASHSASEMQMETEGLESAEEGAPEALTIAEQSEPRRGRNRSVLGRRR